MKLKKLKRRNRVHSSKIFSKRINGSRAYELAREGFDFELNFSKMEIFDIKLLKYNHPFITLKLLLAREVI